MIRIGIYARIEPDAIRPSTYPKPVPERAGDLSGASLLRNALRLNLRADAGPFRSVGRVAFAPRPYQYVPLAMSLKMNPVRMLIADDVGVGKTIEAGLVARELLDRGSAKRIGALCPPHLCEQWENELRDKFGIDAAVVQSSKMARLEPAAPPRHSYIRALQAHRGFNRLCEVRPSLQVFRGQRPGSNHRGRSARRRSTARRRKRSAAHKQRLEHDYI